MKFIASLLLALFILAIHPAMSQDEDYWISQTKSDYHNGSYSLALEDIDEYLKINESDIWAWSFRANLLIKMERYSEAVKSFDRIIALDSSNADVYNDRALILSGAMNQDDEALASLEVALQIDPLNSNTWYNKGMILEKMERHNDALEAYGRAIDLNEDLERAWLRQGYVLMMAESYNESLASLERAIELNSENAEAWNDKGLVLMKLGRNGEAMDCFGKAVQLDPANKFYQENLDDMDPLAMGDLSMGDLAEDDFSMDDLKGDA